MWLFALGLSTLFAVGLVVYRVQTTHERFYAFMTWNLFLAWLPFLFSFFLVHFARIRGFGWLSVLTLGVLWLLFFPNGPYVVTDLIHFSYWKGGISQWFDLLMLFTSAWTGLLLGLLSLYMLQRLVDERYGLAAGWLFALVSLVLCSIGVYVGRFLRWNSWEVLTDPKTLWRDITRLNDFQPMEFIALFALGLAVAYGVTYALVARK